MSAPSTDHAANMQSQDRVVGDSGPKRHHLAQAIFRRPVGLQPAVGARAGVDAEVVWILPSERTNPAPAAKKPSAPRQRAVQPLAPRQVEALRRQLLKDSRHGLRDATLISALAYAGLRPEEALALAWTHVRANTLLIERKLVRGELVQGQKTRRTLRTVALLSPLAEDLAAYGQTSVAPENRVDAIRLWQQQALGEVERLLAPSYVDPRTRRRLRVLAKLLRAVRV